jgi:hypothetical protein
MLGVARLRIAVEEHGAGRQLVRFSMWPKYSRFGLALTAACAGLALGAAIEGVHIAALTLGAVAAVIGLSAIRDSATATGVLLRVLVGRTRKEQVFRRGSQLRVAELDDANGHVAGYLNGNGAAPSTNGHDVITSPAGFDELQSRSQIARFSSHE